MIQLNIYPEKIQLKVILLMIQLIIYPEKIQIKVILVKSKVACLINDSTLESNHPVCIIVFPTNTLFSFVISLQKGLKNFFSINNTELVIFEQSLSQKNNVILHTVSDYGFRGTVVNRAHPSLKGRSNNNMTTVYLQDSSFKGTVPKINFIISSFLYFLNIQQLTV